MATSIHNLETELFNKWKADFGYDSQFVYDGVVNEDCYSRLAPKKIVFLLKEVNGGDTWSLCDFLGKKNGERYNKAKNKLWDNVARWSEGIFKLGVEIEWSDLEDMNEHRRGEILNKICVVNVKKTSGTNTADSKMLKRVMANESEYLKEQLSFYSADVIICGNTQDNFMNDILSKKGCTWSYTSRGIQYTHYNQSLVIGYCHPAARIWDNLLYYGLIDALKDIFYSK